MIIVALGVATPPPDRHAPRRSTIGLHMSSFGSSFFGVLVIDYVFHVPLFIAAMVLIWGFVGMLRNRSIDVHTVVTEGELSAR